mgnify:CR=1 FL=1
MAQMYDFPLLKEVPAYAELLPVNKEVLGELQQMNDEEVGLRIVVAGEVIPNIELFPSSMALPLLLNPDGSPVHPWEICIMKRKTPVY